MKEAVTVTMSTIVTDIGTFFTGAIAWVGDVIEVVVSNPLLMCLVVAVPLSGWAIGALKRLIRL